MNRDVDKPDIGTVVGELGDEHFIVCKRTESGRYTLRLHRPAGSEPPHYAALILSPDEARTLQRVMARVVFD